jgi:hypothetical protein
MLYSIILLCLFEAALALVPRVPTSGSSDVCKNGLYAKLAPLKYYEPAQSFCNKEYPNTVTVTATTTTNIWKAKRTYPLTTTTTPYTTKSTKKSTTESTTPYTTKSTKKSTTKSTTPYTTKSTKKSTTESTTPYTTESTTSTSTTTAKCTKDSLECLYSSAIGDGAKTVSFL